MENRKLVFLPGGLAHGPYQVEGKRGASWNVPLAPLSCACGSLGPEKRPRQAPHRHPTWKGASARGQARARSAGGASLSLSPACNGPAEGRAGCVYEGRVLFSHEKSRCPEDSMCPVKEGGAHTSLDFQDLSRVSCGTHARHQLSMVRWQFSVTLIYRSKQSHFLQKRSGTGKWTRWPKAGQEEAGLRRGRAGGDSPELTARRPQRGIPATALRWA
uniref:Uncharacterized protein n=1 Tax=Rousettus aegyptiacus TaxID=9407 RepID=A0A7J8BSY2_ROUAE|nr:hypothetical protein HJG63_009657 [Rousettus aegyptiacus]